MQEENSSFRDPSGQVYVAVGQYRRQINPSYIDEYHHLMESGLYKVLADDCLLIPHDELLTIGNTIIIRPEQVEFISYPYEWCFSMLKEAAINTLAINEIALQHGMMLKDASAFNMQWHQGNMVLIDTLSFMDYEAGMPWGAYPQFLRHFLVPLLLMKYKNPTMAGMLLANIDGITPQLATKLLPRHLMLRPSYLAHLYSQSLNVTVNGQRNVKMPAFALKSLLESLKRLVFSLDYKPKSVKTHYADENSYTQKALDDKGFKVTRLLELAGGKTLCDMGANTGFYARKAGIMGYKVLAVDSDHDCVERIDQTSHIFPLVVDICNPSPAIGWDNTERKSFLARLHVDVIMALALIHHLCVGNNVPLHKVAQMLSEHCQKLIIEYVPLNDPKTQLLLGKKNIPPYSYAIFKTAFSDYFTIEREIQIGDSKRILFLMEKR
jgi:hypothetical protein